MSRAIYTLLLYLVQPLVALRLLLRARKLPAYKKRILERYGIFRKPEIKPSIWVHTVSVGETIAAAPMIKKIMATWPQYRLVVTTMTPTGSAQVLKRFGSEVFHVYIPYDLPGAINRFLNKTSPVLAIFMETELWPNILSACKKRGTGVMIANARLSERSARKYSKIPRLTQNMLTAIDTLAAQHQDDAERFLSIGLKEEQLTITGSLKYDLELPEHIHEQGMRLRSRWLENKSNDTRIIIAASTHKGEEEKLIAVFRRVRESFQNILFVIVPRHPERAEEILTLCQSNGLSVARRSVNETVEKHTDLILADTMGEMFLLLSASNIVFMGGSLVPVGGHNFLEPAALGLAQITGPYVFNFQHVAQKLLAAGAMEMASDSEQLEMFLLNLAKNKDTCRKMGEDAINVVKTQQGALKKHLTLIARILNKKNDKKRFTRL